MTMPWKHWACDCSFTPAVWVPVELDESGDITSIVTGMNLLSDRCPGECIAVIHEDGQEAVEAWMAVPENMAWLEAAAGPTGAPEEETR